MSNKISDDTSFGKTIWGTDCKGYEPSYLAAKKRVGEHFCDVPSGGKLCYFKDGEGVPMFCFHGGSEGKFMFLQKEPIPGVQMISFDRHGYGKSTESKMISWDDIIEDVCAVADSLNVPKFVVCGFSIGSSWAMQIAAAKPDRVVGCSVWGTMADTYHPDFPKNQISKVGRPPAILNPKSGCCGCILRSVFAGVVPKMQKMDLKMCFERESKLKKCKPEFANFKADNFWVNCKVDSFLGMHNPQPQLDDAVRSLCQQWHYDIKTIKCPMTITQGAGDYDMGSSAPFAPNFIKQCIPHADLQFVEGCGHVCVWSPTERTRDRVQKLCKEAASAI